MQDANKISIIGHGNVGHHLAIELNHVGVNVTHIVSRNPAKASELANKVGAEIISIHDLPLNQLALMCVPDDTIAPLLEQIDNRIEVAYTSGSVRLNDLPSRKNLGVFYPLQTFTKSKRPKIEEVPFFIEATQPAFSETLIELASRISNNVNRATSEERKKLHITAVMVNNFTNHILHHAKTFADQNDIEFKHLLPLLSETINKLNSDSPYNVQTGPARRGDDQTIQDHIESLDGMTKEIYILLSDSIKKTYSNNDEL